MPACSQRVNEDFSLMVAKYTSTLSKTRPGCVCYLHEEGGYVLPLITLKLNDLQPRTKAVLTLNYFGRKIFNISKPGLCTGI